MESDPNLGMDAAIHYSEKYKTNKPGKDVDVENGDECVILEATAPSSSTNDAAKSTSISIFSKNNQRTRDAIEKPKNARKKKVNREPKPYFCDQCPKRFPRPHVLNEHRHRHTGEYSYLCPVCGFGTISAASLESHLVCHSDEKPFSCDVCGKKFRRRFGLMTHLERTHCTTRPHRCTYQLCTKDFKSESHLKRHMLIHTGANRVKCNVCGHLLGDKQVLANHMRQHTGDKDKKLYKCADCPQEFDNPTTLKMHTVKVHAAAAYKALKELMAASLANK